MSTRAELVKAFAEEGHKAEHASDDDVMLRNAYVLGAVLMRDNIVAMFNRGESLRKIKALYPPEPDVEHLRKLEAERRANIAGN